MIRHRGRAVPVARLAAFLETTTSSPPPARGALNLAVVRHGDDFLALEVDAFEGERSVVVRPLGWPLERIRGLAGAVQLGAQDLALLLHVPDLVEQYRESAGRFVARGIARAEARQRVLVVDDSVITRQLERRILEGLGFEVELAVDGQDALRALETSAALPSLILSDVEMPRLDGLGLVRKIRRDPRLKDIPVVIVSTRGAEEDRRAGLDAGADAYIVKSAFEEATLRETIDRLLT